MNLRMLFITGLACLFLFACGVCGQTSPQDGKTFPVRTNLLVLDDKNEYVNSIRETDVKLFENGVEKKLTYFAAKDQALDVSIVVDNSGSVNKQLPNVMLAAKLIVANLRPSDEATLIRFVDQQHISVEQEWTSNKADLNEGIDDLYISGGQSAVIDALYLAGDDILKRRRTAPNRRYAIVLISDGEERDSFYSPKKLFKLLDGTDVQIFSIAITAGLPSEAVRDSERLVNTLTVRTGGTPFFIGANATKDALQNSLKSLLFELRAQYIVGYTATNITKETITRKFSATVADGYNGEKRKVVNKEMIDLTLKR